MNRITPLLVTAAAALLAHPAGSSAQGVAPAAESVAEAEPDQAKDDSAIPEPRPVFIEADLPRGFPQPGPAYEVLLKQYPVYRAARAEGGNAFRKLFNHIQSHDIAMTAPVEMTLEPPGDDDRRVDRMDMLFMYADPEMGELGPDDTARPGEDVEVVELPPIQVLSLGFFGDADRQQINDALAMLQRHLADRPELVALGPPRLLGYNSPMVPARNRYSEVQIPVGPAENAEDAASPQADSPADADAPAADHDTKTPH